MSIHGIAGRHLGGGDLLSYVIGLIFGNVAKLRAAPMNRAIDHWERGIGVSRGEASLGEQLNRSH